MSQHDNKQKLFGNFSWFPAFSQEHLPPHKCGMEKASNYGSFSRFHRTSTHLKIAWTIWTCLHLQLFTGGSAIFAWLWKLSWKHRQAHQHRQLVSVHQIFLFLLQAVRSQAHYSQQTKATTSWSQTYIYIMLSHSKGYVQKTGETKDLNHWFHALNYNIPMDI